MIVDDGRLTVVVLGDTARQTAVVTAKPNATVARGVGAHHDIAEHRTVLLCIVGYGFLRLRIIDEDTSVVRTQPVVTETVLADGIDVTQLQIHHAGRSLLIHIHAVLVRAYPHQSLGVHIDIAQGVFAERRFVELVVQELTHLMVLQIEYQQSLMVGSQPDMSLGIHLQVPYLQVVRHILYLVFAEQRRIADTPLTVLVHAHIGVVFCRHPDVTVVIHTQVVFLVLRRAVVTHPLVVIHLLTLLTIETNQFTVRRDHHHTVVTGRIGREVIRGVQLVVAVAEVKVGNLLGIGVIVI